MKETIDAKEMLSYLQALLNDFMEDRETYGPGDRIVQKRMHGMIACKEMVEALIRVPVNLQKDGKVTVGF
ncbi:MAG: hypothetical protein II008_03810 [Oscillospiraceae bacterium]|nr:hypothetical protein [Oscillospiraceae bacterium]